MDGLVVTLFVTATFLGGLTSGIAGFAMGLVVSGVWLHILTPLQTATLIVGFGLVTQGYAIWKLRGALDWRRVTPFLLGGIVGVPVGTMLLTYIDPSRVRLAVGLLLIAYSAYAYARPRFKPVAANVPADMAIGVLNGLLGGLTGLTGIVVTVWCQLLGLSKDEQRTVFQPVNLATIVITAVALASTGAVTQQTAKLYILGLPVLLAGLWSGFKLYGKLDDAGFRKVILLLLLIAGAALVGPAIWRRLAAG